MTENDENKKYDFEWDPKKAKRNLKKHGVSFEEASTIFDDPDFISLLDDEHWRMKNVRLQLECRTKSAS